MVKDILKELHPVSLMIGVICIIAIIVYGDAGALKQWVEESGRWAPMTFILAKTLTVVIAPLSGGPLYPLAGFLFGFPEGLLLTLIGDLLGFTAAFFISRLFGQQKALAFMGQTDNKIIQKLFVATESTKGFFLASIAFIAAPEVLAYGTGLTRLPYITYISIFMPIWTLASGAVIFLGSLFGDDPIFIKAIMPLIIVTLFFTGTWLMLRDDSKDGL